MSRNSLEERCSIIRRSISMYKRELIETDDPAKQVILNRKIDELKVEENQCLKDMGVEL